MDNILDHAPRRTIIKTLLTLALCLTAAPGRATTPEGQGLDELRREMQELRQRVEILEQQLARANQDAGVNTREDRAEPLVATKVPAGTPAAGNASLAEEAQVSLGGRVKLDAYYNSASSGAGSGNNRSDLSFLPASIPLDKSGESDQFSYSARESRLWITAHSVTPFGDIGGYVEMDFFSGDDSGNERVSNSYLPRLRHAYARLGGFTAGQTYTTFLNVSAYPELNDANGPLGILNIRQPLVRYQRDTTWGNIQLALENPETTLTLNSGATLAPDDDQVPDFVGKAEVQGTWGNWSVAGLVRRLRYDNAGSAGTADAAWGGAISASGRIGVFGRDDLRFALTWGNALGRYLSFNAFNDGSIDAAGNIRPTEMYGGFVAYQHWWTPSLRSTAALGYAAADNDLRLVPGTVNAGLFSSHLNLLWSPSPRATVGIEWIHGRRELENGRHGSLDRMQISSIYRF